MKTMFVAVVATLGVSACGAGGSNPSGGADGGAASPGGRVFVTSGTYTGDLATQGNASSGLGGADNLCNRIAQAAGVDGTFVAWLSASGAYEANGRLNDFDGGWYQLDGTTRVLTFRSKAAMISAPLAALQYDENGTKVTGGTNVWTGTANDGHAGVSTCNAWSSADLSINGVMGSTADTSDWTDEGSLNCIETNHLYCFQQP